MAHNQYSSYSLDPLGRARFYGVYKGIVTFTNDPLNQKRISIKVPQVTGADILELVSPTAPSDVFSSIQIPTVGAYVWVMFESGDPNYPVWMSSTKTGVPVGGTAGQVLAKIDGTNYNTQWVTSSGSSGVSSVDGLTGAVTLSGTYLTQTNAASTYEPKITAGTTAQYFRGDKSLATFPTALSSFSNDTNFITSSALTGYLTSSTASTTYAPIAQTMFIGTTSTAINRSSASQTLTGVNIDGNAGTVTNGVYTTDTGTVTSTMILDGTIVNGDINASATIADTKLAQITTANKVSGTAITTGNISTSGNITTTGNFQAGSGSGVLGTLKLFSAYTGNPGTIIQAGWASSGSTNTLTLPTTSGTLLNDQITSLPAGITSIPNVTTANSLTSATSLSSVGTITSGTWNGGIVPVLYGGTGLSFNDKTLVGRGTQLAGVSGSATGGTMTNAFQDTGTPKYILVDASSVYYFEAYFPITKAASSTNAQWSVSVIYQDTSGTSITPAYMYTAVNAWTNGTIEGTATSTSVNTAISFGTGGTTAVTRVMRLVGYITTNSSTAGRMSIGFGQSANASSGTPSTGANAFIAVYKMSTAASERVGNWS